jgi:hypothetical protein
VHVASKISRKIAVQLPSYNLYFGIQWINLIPRCFQGIGGPPHSLVLISTTELVSLRRVTGGVPYW